MISDEEALKNIKKAVTAGMWEPFIQWCFTAGVEHGRFSAPLNAETERTYILNLLCSDEYRHFCRDLGIANPTELEQQRSWLKNKLEQR